MHVWSRTAKMATAAGIALAAVTVTGAAAGATAAKTPAAAASPWSQGDYNAAQSRANLTEQTLTATTIGNARYLRSLTSPPPPIDGFCNNVPDQGVVAPSLAGGDVYAMTDGVLTKYNAATGATIWQANPDPAFGQTYVAVAVSGGLVVVGGFGCGSVSEPRGTMWAFHASTGKLAWSKPMPRDGNLVTLVVSNGFVVAGGSSDASGLTIDVRKLSSGANVWTRGQGVDCTFFPFPLTVVGQVVVGPNACTPNETFTGFNLTTGAAMWKLTGNWNLLRGDSDSAAGRHLFATNPSGAVVSLDPQTGQTQYSLTGAASVLAVDGSQAYGACGGGNNTQVCAYDTSTGGLNWQFNPNLGSQAMLAAEAGGVLYLDSGFAVDTTTGKSLATLWSPFARSAATSIAIGDGRVAAVNDSRIIDLYGLAGS